MASSLVKIIMLDDTKAVAFAGDPYFAKMALLMYRKKVFRSRLEITQFFLVRHVESQERVDFILMYLGPPQILSIKGSEVKNAGPSKTGWIGDRDGFARFQHFWHSKERPSAVPEWETPLASTNDPIEGSGLGPRALRMILTLRYVIIEARAPSVGGFEIALSSASGKFQYVKYALVLHSKFKAVPAQSVLRWQLEEQENYAKSCIITLPESSVKAVGVHFWIGLVTYVYVDTGGGFLDKVLTFKNMNFAEFEKASFEQIGAMWEAFIVDHRGVAPLDSRNYDRRQRLSKPKDRIEIDQQ